MQIKISHNRILKKLNLLHIIIDNNDRKSFMYVLKKFFIKDIKNKGECVLNKELALAYAIKIKKNNMVLQCIKVDPIIFTICAIYF